TLEANVGALLPVRRVRWAHATLLGIHASNDTFDCSTCDRPIASVVRRRSARLGWSFDSSKTYGYSISAEEGGRVAATSETTRRALGADGDAESVTFDARVYRRAFRTHGGGARRGAAGAASGDAIAERRFDLGGSGPPAGGFGFGSDAVGLIRGFDAGSVTATHVALANADYRFPILVIERGMGTLPFF